MGLRRPGRLPRLPRERHRGEAGDEPDRDDPEGVAVGHDIGFPPRLGRDHAERLRPRRDGIDRFARDGQIAVEGGEMAADLFLGLVLGRLSRLAMLGIAIDPGQVGRRVEAAVALFLHGVGTPRG